MIFVEKQCFLAEFETQRVSNLAAWSRRGWYVKDRNGTYQVKPLEEKGLVDLEG